MQTWCFARGLPGGANWEGESRAPCHDHRQLQIAERCLPCNRWNLGARVCCSSGRTDKAILVALLEVTSLKLRSLLTFFVPLLLFGMVKAEISCQLSSFSVFVLDPCREMGRWLRKVSGWEAASP